MFHLRVDRARNIDKLFSTLELVARERRKRVTTGADEPLPRARRLPARHRADGKRVKIRIFYMTQAAVAPPTFILFTDRDVKLHFAFERFLENQIRAAFGFVGSPSGSRIAPVARERSSNSSHKRLCQGTASVSA